MAKDTNKTFQGFTKHSIKDLGDIHGKGIYIVTKKDNPLYVGQSGKFQDRLTDDHEKIQKAIKQGATDIYTKSNQDGKDARLKQEEKLIKSLNPPLNEQNKPKNGQ